MKIDILCNDGSPLEVTEMSIHGKDGRKGVGGAELFLLTMCRAWYDAGHEVVLYNNPMYPDGSVFEQKPISQFNPKEKRDILIVWRSPSALVTDDIEGKVVWVSTDQSTVGDFRAFAQKADKIVTISPHHAEHFKTHYGITDTITIDIPVRIWEYENKDIEKIPYRCLFNHIPDRGIEQLRPAWAVIVRDFPEAHLCITSDWRLWDKMLGEDVIWRFKQLFARIPNVSYFGAVKRDELIKIQLESQLNLYPSIYHELFCISVAENSVAGCYPITTDIGALETTNMGTIIPGSSLTPDWQTKFIDTTLELLNDQELWKKKSDELMQKAKERFSLERILDIWDKEVFND